MVLQLNLSTGDVTTPSRALRRFSIEVDRPPTIVSISFSEVSGIVSFNDWPLLVEQVKNHELVKRHSFQGMPPPLSQIKDVLAQISSTPTYQLFLAGTDIAERIDLLSESSLDGVKRRFKILDRWMPSVTGAGGLFFVPGDTLARAQQPAVEELMLNNKLCSASFADLQRYYVPYATPIGFVLKVSKEAAVLWDEIHKSYNAFRYTA